MVYTIFNLHTINQTICLIETNVDFSVKNQFEVVQVQAEEAFVPREVLGNVATKPNGLAGTNRLSRQVDQSVYGLIVVNGHFCIYDVAETVHRVSLPYRVFWAGIRH